MTPLATLLWAGNLCCDTSGQLFFKAAARRADHLDGWEHWKRLFATPTLWLGGVAFVAEFFLYMAFLSVVPLSQGVLLGSIDVVSVMIGGRLLFGEKLSPRRVSAIIAIAVGVALVGWA